jgi:hypothetical protein
VELTRSAKSTVTTRRDSRGVVTPRVYGRHVGRIRPEERSRAQPTGSENEGAQGPQLARFKDRLSARAGSGS